ncbi:MAG: hypothetical protein OEY92_02070 [Elusimicrobiota bacterium]|nr:hypothetical protein [Elusimicrobiota bacterium]
MTHTMHRQGSVESLKEDYVVLVMGGDIPFDIYRRLWQKRFPRIYEMVKKVLLNLGILKLLRIIKKAKPTGSCRSPVFNNKRELAGYLKQLKEKNRGKSVVVSGLFDEVNDCLKELNLYPHTVQFSLGIFGKKELLPEKEILEITTMCGHHMISAPLVEKLTSDIKNGNVSLEEAIRVMSEQCVCGVFNKERTCKLMAALIDRLYSLSYDKTRATY